MNKSWGTSQALVFMKYTLSTKLNYLMFKALQSNVKFKHVCQLFMFYAISVTTCPNNHIKKSFIYNDLPDHSKILYCIIWDTFAIAMKPQEVSGTPQGISKTHISLWE